MFFVCSNFVCARLDAGCLLIGMSCRHFAGLKRLERNLLEENLDLPRSVELLPREVEVLCLEGLE